MVLWGGRSQGGADEGRGGEDRVGLLLGGLLVQKVRDVF